jgi:tetratricopeptide (TPR) repeat protein
LPVLAASGLGAVAYLNALGNPFVYDDQLEVLENSAIQGPFNLVTLLLSNLTRPILNLTYAADFAVWGGADPFGFHLTNVLLHVLNVGLLFALVAGFTRDVEATEATPPAASTGQVAAFVAASLFAVHPLMTEAVGYVSARSEVLGATLFMGSLYCLRRRLLRGAWPWLAAGLALFALALGVRETAVALPFVLLAYDRLLLRNGHARARRFARLHAPLIAVVVLLAVARVWLYMVVEHADGDRFIWQNVFLTLHVMARYVALLVLPMGQSLVQGTHPIWTWWDVRVAMAIALLGVLALGAIKFRRRRPIMTLGLAWFGVVLVPSSALILLTNYGQPMAEHRAYLASCGFFAAVGAIVGRVVWPWLAAGRRTPVPLAVTFATLLALLLSLTVARNRVWADPVTLWSDAVEKSPGTFQAQFGLANAYRARGDHAAAEPVYLRAIALRPALVEGYLGLAESFLEGGQQQKACETLRLAMLRIPADPRPRLALAALQEPTNAAESLELCRHVLELRPGLREAEECVRRSQARLIRRD